MSKGTGTEIATWPEKVFLQHGAEGSDDCSYPGRDDVTWCDHAIHNSDICYVRADRIATLSALLKETKEALEKIVESVDGNNYLLSFERIQNTARATLEKLEKEGM